MKIGLRLSLLAILFAFQTLLSVGQQDSWSQIVGDGFSISIQNTVPEMEVYNGPLPQRVLDWQNYIDL